MGNHRMNPSDWITHTQKIKSQPRAQIFRQNSIQDDLDPSKIQIRESVDSDANPNSTPIILGSDCTASMGHLAELVIKKDFGTIMTEIYDRKPVADPHLMCMVIGDANCDRSPLQVTQFEADLTLVDQLKNFHIEQGGGGNGGESYHLAWYFAAHKTHCDSMIKRNKKGYLFTIGDECVHSVLRADHVERFIGEKVEADIQTKDLLETVQQSWEVFHLIISPCRGQNVLASWRDLLGERAIEVSDHNMLAEVIVSIVQANEGENVDDVANSWSGDTAIVVRDAIKDLSSIGTNKGVVTL